MESRGKSKHDMAQGKSSKSVVKSVAPQQPMAEKPLRSSAFPLRRRAVGVHALKPKRH